MYVLTNIQFNEAIIQGAAALGVIDAAQADALMKSPAALRIGRAANGFVVLTADNVASVASPAPAAGSKKQARAAAAPASTTAPAADEGPDPANVKAALKNAMEHPPGINSIQTWTASERRAAIRWSKDPTKTRPEFIKERAARGSKQAPSSPPPAANGSLANGVASTTADFFDQPDADA